jgi:hypothetical protein
MNNAIKSYTIFPTENLRNLNKNSTMASFTVVTSLSKFGSAAATIARARPWNSRVFAAASPRLIQVNNYSHSWL